MAILKKAPAGSQVLDLGAARAARAEARAEAGETSQFVKLSVGFVEVTPEIPLSVVSDLQENRIREGLAGLLVDPADIDALMGELTTGDIEGLTAFITGASLGESSASPAL